MDNKTQLFGIEIDVLDMKGAVDRLRVWIETVSYTHLTLPTKA